MEFHHETHEIHHRSEGKEGDQGAQIVDTGECSDDDDHYRGTKGVLVPPVGIHVFLQEVHIALVKKR